MRARPTYLEAMRSLSVDESYLDALLDKAPFGIWLEHPSRGCVYTNQVILDLFAVSWEEFVEYRWVSRVDPADAERLRAAVERFNQDLAPVSIAYRVLVPDQEPRWLQVQVTALRGADGQHLGTLAVSMEVSEQRRLIEESVERQKLEAVGRLAARVAHDCNNLFGVVLGCSSLLELSATPPQREHLKLIDDAIDRASGLTTQLLLLSHRRVRTNNVCSLDQELERLLPIVSRTLGEGIQVDQRLEAPDVWVPLDGGELGQIVLNLAVNGSDAMQARGQLRVRSSRRGRHALLEVEDAGCGMDEETASQALAPFFTTKGEGRGTGLGLFTVAELVRTAGGTIEVDSAPGQGTRVKVELPAVTPELFGANSTVAQPPPEATGRLLLVEDQGDLRQTLAYALALSGYDVTTASNLAEARERAEALPPDVVVVDVMLPDGLGTELVEALRAQRPNLPVVFVSGFAGEACDALAPDGRTHFLEKPFRPRELLVVLSQLAAT
ncbi:MAG: ATP-binding protein [Planctomycetota bacterium]